MKSKIEVKKILIDSAKDTLIYLNELVIKENLSETSNLIFVIKSELQEVNKLNTAGVISFDEYSRLMSKIRLNILNIIEQIPDNLFNKNTPKPQTEKNSEPKQSKDAIFLEVLSLIRQLSDVRIRELSVQNNENAPALYSQLNTNRHILLNQIIKLTEVHNFTLSSAEYRVIAEGFQAVLDNIKAAEYYKKAIDTIDEYTESTNSKIVAIRCYAAFLYANNKPLEGAKQFKAAILNGTNDEAFIFNGYTCQMEFVTEANMGTAQNAVNAFRQSKNYFSNLKNKMMRFQNLQNLEQAWKMSNLHGKYEYPQ